MEQEPSSADVLGVYATSALVAAITQAGSLNTSDVQLALRNLNFMTFFGPANFSGVHQQTVQKWYCMQANADGEIRPVSKNAPTYVQAVYDVPVKAPPGFYPSTN